MACPVTLGFFHSLEHGAGEKTRNTSFEFVGDSLGTLPQLRMQAQLEINQKHEVLQHRAQFAVRTITASCQVKAPQVATDLYTATSIDVMMERLKVALEDTADLLTVSRMKRKGGKDNAHRLSERLAVLGALRALDKMLTAYVKNDFRAVGYGLGDAWRALHLPADFILKTGRKLLEIKE